MTELLMRREPWMTDAACRRIDVDADWWHADGYQAKKYTAEAKRICREECPFMTECLTLALDVEGRLGGVRWGVYGGMDADERAKIAGGK